MRRKGFLTFAVDHEHNRHRSHVSLLLIDLATPHGQGIIRRMIQHLEPVSLHLGLPCGTSSRARERALPSKFSEFNAPPPLRDAFHVLGLPNLRDHDRQKVETANKLYGFAVEILQIAYKKDIIVSIENPTRSWLWAVLAHFVRDCDEDFRRWFANICRVDFHSCMHGGQRDKATRLLVSHDVYNHMAVSCSRDHAHLPWGIHKDGNHLHFDTAAEAEYPTQMCQTMATALADRIHLPNVPDPQLSSSQTAQVARGGMMFTRKPLIPEFSRVYDSPTPVEQPGHKLLKSHFPGDITGTNSQMMPDDSPMMPDEIQVETPNVKRDEAYLSIWCSVDA